MVKDHVLSYHEQSQRPSILIFTYMLHHISKNIVFKFRAELNYFVTIPRYVFVFLPSLPLALSVVSMYLLSPHKMAEIRLSA